MSGSSELSVLALFLMGGPFMWPLAVFSVATLGIALERVIYFCRHPLGVTGVEQRVDALLRLDQRDKAVSWLQTIADRRPAARVFLAVLQAGGGDGGAAMANRSELEKIAEDEAVACVNDIENGFNFLSSIGSVAPLTGFLGTVAGMIGAFRSIALATDVNAQIVANGIFEALITTAFGLMIAIAAMVVHALLSHAVDRFVIRMEESCTRLIRGLCRDAS